MTDTTLVLDQSYRVHRIVPWQRAIHMLFDDKIEVLSEYDEDIRSPSLTLRKPAVVRLLRKVKTKGRSVPGVRFSRVNVALRDDFKCQYCGVRLSLAKATYDHVVPKSKGGTTSWTNIVIACKVCNGHKKDKTPEQAGLSLLRSPVEPTHLPVISGHVHSRQSIHALWEPWLPTVERE